MSEVIRSNHAVLVAPGQQVRYNRWSDIQPRLQRRPETRYIREIIFAQVRAIRDYEISRTESPTTQPLETWLLITNLPGVLAVELRWAVQPSRLD